MEFLGGPYTFYDDNLFDPADFTQLQPPILAKTLKDMYTDEEFWKPYRRIFKSPQLHKKETCELLEFLMSTNFSIETCGLYACLASMISNRDPHVFYKILMKKLQVNLKITEDMHEKSEMMMSMVYKSIINQNETFVIDDISNGMELTPIPAINEKNFTKFPTSIYRMKSEIGVGIDKAIKIGIADGGFSVHCSCTTDGLCNSSSCDCINSFDGRPAYSNGMLKDFDVDCIKECNSWCGCGDNCRNKIIQRKQRNNVEVFYVNDYVRWGVRSKQKIRPGEFLAEYIGEIISEQEAERRGKIYDSDGCSYIFDLYERNLYSIDSKKYGNFTKFMNHCCTPNLVAKNVCNEVLDKRMSTIAFFAKKEILPGEELTFDYCYANQQTDRCYCGSPQCRKYLK